TVKLVITYRRAKEEPPGETLDLPAGDLRDTGTATILGRQVSRQVLVHQGEVTEVLYGDVEEGRLAFSFRLSDSSGDHESASITDAQQAHADQILSSLSLSGTEGEAARTQDQGWETYRSVDYGFVLQYPSAWTLEERPHLVILRKGALTMQIGYRRTAEAEVHIEGGGGLGAGELREAGTVAVLGRDVPRTVLVHQGKVKHVLYRLIEADQSGLEFAASLVSEG
ncbi:unnamed protein product, partial [marine sediment metagenome]